MAPILAQMRRDPVRAGRDRRERGLHGIGMPPAARVADGRDMVDVDAEAQVRRVGHAMTQICGATRRSNSLLS
jgi:hypothetical protein